MKTRYVWEQVAFLWSPRRLETRQLATLGKGGIQLKFRYGEEQGIYLIHLKACEGGNKAAL